MKILQTLRNKIEARRSNSAEKRKADSIGTLVATNPRRIASYNRSHRRQVAKSSAYLNKIGCSHLVKNWYESGNPFSDGSRSYLPEVLTDARYDQNQITSREAMRRMRYWEQNSVFVNKVCNLDNQYIIGPHTPVVTPMSSSPAWNQIAETVWHEFCDSAGLNGESLFEMLLVGNRRKKIDRDVFFIQTNKPGSVTIRRGTKYETKLDVSVPCYQMVESHRVGSTFAMMSKEGFDCFDGIEYQEIKTKLPSGETVKQKIKVAYWVNESGNWLSVDEGFFRVPVQFCYRAATPHRVNETRGITDFFAVEPTLALLEDLLKLEMRAQEVQSDIAMIIKNGSGQIVNEKTQSMLGAFGVAVSKDASGNAIVTAKELDEVKAVYEKIWGGRKMVLRTGDEAEMAAPTRPAEATLNLWNFLINSFCTGIDRPRFLVFPAFAKGQGTEVRASIEAFAASCRTEFNLVWKPFIHQAWEYFIGWAIKNDERLKNAPSDWNKIEVSAPRSPVVDLGYDSAADLAEMAAGVLPLHNWAQKRGTTREKIISQSVKDIFDIKLACAQMAELPEYSKNGITVEITEVRQDLAKVSTSESQSEKTSD